MNDNVAPEAAKRSGCLTVAKWLGITFAAFVAISMIWRVVDPEGYEAAQAEQQAERDRQAAEERQAEAEQQAEEDAKRQSGFHCLSAWDGSHRGVATAVKDALRDPSSFEHDETLISVNQAGEHRLTMTYRAKNGFGGMNVERAYARIDHESCDVIAISQSPIE